MEILIAAGVLALLSVVIVQSFVSTIRGNTKSEVIKNIKQEGDYALHVMERMIQGARSLTCNSLTSLTVTAVDDNTTTFECLYDAGSEVTRISSTSAQAKYLTSTNVTMGGSGCSGSSLNFSCTIPMDAPASVSISFSLSQAGTPQSQFEKAGQSFQTTVTLRN